MQKVKLNIVPKGVKKTAYLSQNDNGRVVRYELFNELIPYILDGSETITVKVVRPDGEEILANIENTFEGKAYIDVTFNDDMSAITGVGAGEIKITDGETELGSHNFDLNIERDAYGEDITVETASGVIATFTTGVIDNLVGLKTTFEPKQAGSGDPSPDNIREISGYSSANITRSGVNIWDEEIEEGRLNPLDGTEVSANDYYRSKNFIPCKGGVSYYGVAINSPLTFVIVFYGKNQDYLGYLPTASVRNQVFSIPNGVSFFRLYYTGGNYSISINYPSTNTTYQPYTGNTYNIPFGQTVYGGVLDVTRGKLHVTHLNFDVGSVLFTYSSRNDANTGNVFFYLMKSAKTNSSMLSSSFSNVNYPSWTAIDVNTGGFRGNYLILCAEYPDAASFKTAMNGVQCVYELATPFDIDLGSGTAVTALAGVNNVWSDTNGETEVKYYVKEA